MRSRPFLVGLGVVLWGFFFSLLSWILMGPLGGTLGRSANLLHPHRILVVFDVEPFIRPGDRVLMPDGLREVGVVRRCERSGKQWGVEVDLYPGEVVRLGKSPGFQLGKGDLTASWVLATLLPSERLDRLKDRFSGFVLENRDRMAQAILPVATGFSAAAYRILSKDLSSVLEENPVLMRKIGEAVRRGYGEHLEPLVEEIVFPRAGKEAEAIGEKIFEDFYDQISVWALGWKAFWNEEELQDYVLFHLREATQKQKAALSESGRKVASKIWESDRFQEGVQRLAAAVLEDPEVQSGLADIGTTLVRRNEEELYEAIQKHGSSPKWRKELMEIVNELEPVLEELVEEVALAPGEESISDELARVIRRNVLKKDLAWLVVEPSGDRGVPEIGARFQGSSP